MRLAYHIATRFVGSSTDDFLVYCYSIPSFHETCRITTWCETLMEIKVASSYSRNPTVPKSDVIPITDHHPEYFRGMFIQHQKDRGSVHHITISSMIG